MIKTKNCALHAFSLIELSIVLVILGLLTGGILAGKSLIHAAEMRSVGVEYGRYRTAALSFRDKYYMLPGDINNAQQFWGTATCPGDYTTPATDSKTCNGNGDGLIGSNEVLRFWQHLSNAGLVEGAYIGVPSNADGYAFGVVAPYNVPMSRANRAEWMARSVGEVAISDAVYFEGSYGNVLMLDQFQSVLTSIIPHPFIPEDAWNIDTKLDDGKPGTGKVRTGEYLGVSCNTVAASTTVSVAATAAYNLTQTSPYCALTFLTGF
jgi:prepilin-type N-terminal cleavage/methylation domain-containing protein